MPWFDNGVNHRVYDPLKLKGGRVLLQPRQAVGQGRFDQHQGQRHCAGSILDFEKTIRGPKEILPVAWQVDEPIGTTWGYTSDMRVSTAETVLGKLIDLVSKNGNLLLNLSPMADGTLPEAQQQTLLEVGQWLTVNGDAIYGTHNWTSFSEGTGRTGYHFTVKGDDLYAIAPAWPG